MLASHRGRNNTGRARRAAMMNPLMTTPNSAGEPPPGWREDLLGRLDRLGNLVDAMLADCGPHPAMARFMDGIRARTCEARESLREAPPGTASPEDNSPATRCAGLGGSVGGIVRQADAALGEFADSAPLALLADLQQLRSAALELGARAARLSPEPSPAARSAGNPAGGTEPFPAPVSPGRVLIVDDQPENRDLLQHPLRAIRCDVRLAADGAEALRLAAAEPPDLVLLDVRMPGMDGYEVCRRLRSLPATRDVPVIFLSAAHEPAEIARGFEVGAVDYVSKPFRLAELMARVRTHLELKRSRDELARHAASLAALNRQKDRLIEIASHDLRNPLQSAHLGCRQLLDGRGVTAPDAGQRRGLELVLNAVERMSELVGSILDYRTATTGELPFQPASVDLSALVRTALQAAQPIAAAKGIQLRAEPAADLPAARADAARVAQALANYTGNAIKFSPAGRTITVATRRVEGGLRVEVRDEGPGVLPAERGQLFEEFVRLSNQPTGGESSTGLGLAIVRRLITSQGGAVGADFPAAGGSVFWFTLPTA